MPCIKESSLRKNTTSSFVRSQQKNTQYIVYEQAWDNMFDRLARYKDQVGNCMVSRFYQDDLKLSRWVNKQRQVAGSISQSRKGRLDSIGFVWSQPRESWGAMYQQLVEYKHTFGDCLVPWKYKNNQKLGYWVEHQRRLGKSIISKERKERLNRLGFIWKINDSWLEMYQHLLKYKKENGDCLVPQRFWQNPKLGNWVRLQRVRRKSLSVGKSNMLKSVGFVWNARKGF